MVSGVGSVADRSGISRRAHSTKCGHWLLIASKPPAKKSNDDRCHPRIENVDVHGVATLNDMNRFVGFLRRLHGQIDGQRTHLVSRSYVGRLIVENDIFGMIERDGQVRFHVFQTLRAQLSGDELRLTVDVVRRTNAFGAEVELRTAIDDRYPWTRMRTREHVIDLLRRDERTMIESAVRRRIRTAVGFGQWDPPDFGGLILHR